MFSCRCSPSCFPDKTEFQNHIGAKRQKNAKTKKNNQSPRHWLLREDDNTPKKMTKNAKKKARCLPFQVQVQVQVQVTSD